MPLKSWRPRVRTCAFLLISFPIATSALAQDSWARVQSLPAGTRLEITAEHKTYKCSLVSAANDGLTCGATTLSRADIHKVRLLQKGKSVGIGAALGAGIGAGVGVGIGSAINSSDKGDLLHVSGGKAAGVSAGVGAIVGGLAGAFVGLGTNLFGTTIYKQ